MINDTKLTMIPYYGHGTILYPVLYYTYYYYLKEVLLEKVLVENLKHIFKEENRIKPALNIKIFKNLIKIVILRYNSYPPPKKLKPKTPVVHKGYPKESNNYGKVLANRPEDPVYGYWLRFRIRLRDMGVKKGGRHTTLFSKKGA